MNVRRGKLLASHQLSDEICTQKKEQANTEIPRLAYSLHETPGRPLNRSTMKALRVRQRMTRKYTKKCYKSQRIQLRPIEARGVGPSLRNRRYCLFTH